MKVANALGATREAASSSTPRRSASAGSKFAWGRETGRGELTSRRIMATKILGPLVDLEGRQRRSRRDSRARGSRAIIRAGGSSTTTDKKRFYEIPGVYAGAHAVVALQEGFRTESRTLSITGAARVDFALVRR